jgi:uncharacterized membrane protein YraQ (UPF0718 family)
MAYGLLYVDDQQQALQAWALFFRVMQQMLTVLGLVFLLLLVANLLLTPKSVERYLGKEAGYKGWLASVIAGVFSMGPVYAWYPVLAELQNKGMRTGLVAAFLYSRAVKLPLLPLLVFYFGLTYTLVLCLYLILFSVANGILVEKLMVKQ